MCRLSWNLGASTSWNPQGLPRPVMELLFLSCKANARVKLAKSGHGPHLFRIIVFCVVLVIVLCYRLYAVLLLLCCTVIVLLCYYLCCPTYWLCVLYHCHRVLTQLQLTNISISKTRIGRGHDLIVKQGHGDDCRVKFIAIWFATSGILSNVMLYVN